MHTNDRFRSERFATHCTGMDIELATVARRQDGVLSHNDLHGRRLSRRAQARLFETGWLSAVAPGVYMVIDLAHARVDRERLEASIDSALSAPQVLARRLRTLRGSGRWGCRLVDSLLVDSGGHSPLERKFLELMRTAGLPRPTTQAIHRKGARNIARVDFLFEDHGVVIEVTGRLGHASGADRARDAQRRNELQDVGLLVYEYTSADVFRRRSMVIRTMQQRLAASAGSR